MVTLKEIESIARSNRPDLSSYMNCGAINHQIKSALKEELGITVTQIDGGFWYSRSKRAEHSFLKIPATEVNDCEQDVIVDGALKQFHDGNEVEFWFTLGSKSEIPTVVVLDGTTDEERYGLNGMNEWYDMYSKTVP